jgi:membrane protease YdiL (CAAX protease family)
MSTRKGLFYFVIFPGLFIQLIGAFLSFSLFWEKEYGNSIYYLSLVVMVIFSGILLFYSKANLPHFLKKKDRKLSLFLGGGSGIIIAGLIYLFYLLFKGYLFQFSGLVNEAFENLGLKNYFLLFALFVSLLHSLVEEVYWRQFIFRGLNLKLPFIWSLIISSIFFGAHHLLILMVALPFWLAFLLCIPIAVGGGIWALILKRTDSLLGPWISHLIIDLIIMVCIYLIMAGPV